MAVTPIPVGPLFLRPDLAEWMVLPVPFDKVLTVVVVLVFIPIVVIPVVTVVDTVTVIIVAPVLFLAPVILPRGRVTHGRGRCQACRKTNRTE